MNGGDVLAKGGRKCQFPPAGGTVSQEKWDKMFEGFDAEKYRSDADIKADRNAGAQSGKTKSNTVRRTGV